MISSNIEPQEIDSRGFANMAEKLAASTELVIKCRMALFDRSEIELKAREALKSEESRLLALPKEESPINGSNEKAREAQLREKTVELREQLAKAEADVRNARLALENAQDRRRLLSDQLRVYEINICLKTEGEELI